MPKTSNQNPKSGWALLYDEVQRQLKMEESFEAIAAIVAEHPEWIRQVPELKQHLNTVGKEAA